MTLINLKDLNLTLKSNKMVNYYKVNLSKIDIISYIKFFPVF